MVCMRSWGEVCGWMLVSGAAMRVAACHFWASACAHFRFGSRAFELQPSLHIRISFFPWLAGTCLLSRLALACSSNGQTGW